MRVVLFAVAASLVGASEVETPDSIVAWIKENHPAVVEVAESEAKLRDLVVEAFKAQGPTPYGQNVTISKKHSPHKTVKGRDACGGRDVVKSWKNVHYNFPVIFGGMREFQCEKTGYSHYEGTEIVKDPPIPFPFHHMLLWEVWTTDVQCPSSPATPHAGARLEATSRSSCAKLQAEIVARVKAQGSSWHDPHNNGTYYVDSQSDDVLQLHRVTGNHKPGPYTDKMTLTFVATHDPLFTQMKCKVSGCSQSQSASVGDFSTNYCNLRNLYCGKSDGCSPVTGDISIEETWVQPSTGAGKDKSACIVK
jgi:hypothetical protein